VGSVNAYKTNQRDLNIWAGESHDTLQGNYLAINSSITIKFQNLNKHTNSSHQPPLLNQDLSTLPAMMAVPL
jgi:hypothetical protein